MGRGDTDSPFRVLECQGCLTHAPVESSHTQQLEHYTAQECSTFSTTDSVKTCKSPKRFVIKAKIIVHINLHIPIVQGGKATDGFGMYSTTLKRNQLKVRDTNSIYAHLLDGREGNTLISSIIVPQGAFKRTKLKAVCNKRALSGRAGTEQKKEVKNTEQKMVPNQARRDDTFLPETS